MRPAKSRFYQTGLKFECTRCGNCCRLPTGSVEVNEKEVGEMAWSLEMERDCFQKKYCVSESGRWRLRELADGSCIFLREDRCVVYGSRPVQCRTFPFWPENLKSIYRWKGLGDFCPGIDRGPHHELCRIMILLNMQKDRDQT